MLIPFGVFSAGAGGGGAAGSYELISTTVLGSSQPTVTFSVSSYAATYKHLQLRITARSDFSNLYGRLSLRFNSDTGSNYSYHNLTGNGSTATSGAATSQNKIEAGQVAGNTQTANIFATSVIDILDAFSTSKNKTIRSLSGLTGSGGETNIVLNSGLWMSTAAATSIDLTNIYGTNFLTGSRFSLYGIKA